MIRLIIKCLLSAALLFNLSLANAQSYCNGEFPNPLTDICWDCMFPVTLGGSPLKLGITNATDYDTGASTLPICACLSSLSVGVPVGFWEPRFMVDSTNIPGCMPLLGGASINTPFNPMEFGTWRTGHTAFGVNGSARSMFMQVNEYINPILTTLGIISQSPCFDSRSFDIPYFSWADPTWNDDSLSMLLTPYAFAFSGVASLAASMPDAISAATGFPMPELFWVAGSWGNMYPLTGGVMPAYTPEQVTHLLGTRVLAKLHAAGAQQTTAGNDALRACTAYGLPQLIMDKRQYKINRTFPFPDNSCTPIGRNLILQEKGAARPQDKDYGYIIFQRKDCCQPVN